MDSIASASVKYGSSRTRELLFRPLDLKFWLLATLGLSAGDPRQAEMCRLRPYYRGTRLLATMGVLIILPAFLIPFMAPFIGSGGALVLVVLYLVFVLAMCLASLFLEVSLDAVFAIGHEAGCGFSDAFRAFARFVREDPGNAAGYMGAKLLVDTGAMTIVSLFFLPALFTMVFILSSVLHTLQAGQAVSRATAFGGLALVAVFCAAAMLASGLLSVPLSAFYGYYTEETVRRICPVSYAARR
ncbi:conserved hypothetical protein [Methanocella paludicola SANAE]|uniref:Uncharacterized protein n=1 Tax=Methanocella paludicola (strain DSM 17711 / JCM 13418 / NBRC 101707 / SANAE) TaxID=304371 RepID=D1YVD3_METPS|nr:hypothetical protein [Methanocella paludicola]BAI60405.1 conserved hypothetical protein [Methanocella paludicola SANAE]